MAPVLTCSGCGSRVLDIRTFDTMMVLRPDLALFTVRCDNCGARTSSIQSIPADLLDEVRSAAVEVRAGMGAE